MYNELKGALIHNDRYAYQLIRNINKEYKHDVGVLRVTLEGTFSFCQKDLEDFFCKYGKIENIVIKQSNTRLLIDDSLPKDQESIAYIIYIDYFSAILALKILNSVPEKERIVKVQLCCKMSQNQQDNQNIQPMLFHHKVEDFILEIEHVQLFLI